MVFGFVLMEIALVFDWVSGMSGGATYENSPLYWMVLLANLPFAHAPVNVTSYLLFTGSLLSVVTYLSGMVLSIISWWRRWLSLIAGCLVMIDRGHMAGPVPQPIRSHGYQFRFGTLRGRRRGPPPDRSLRIQPRRSAWRPQPAKRPPKERRRLDRISLCQASSPQAAGLPACSQRTR